jgi:diacylglycerol kinase (ATP)
MLLLIVELLNTAVEITIDRISSENHPLSGMAKDVASAAVMLAILLAAGVWIAIAIARWS